MKKMKLLTIMAAVGVSASLYIIPVFATESNSSVNLGAAKVEAKTTTMAAVTLGSAQADVNLELANVQTSASTNTVGATFKVTNTGSTVINLSDVKVRYYFTKDTDTEQEFHCYNANISNPYRALASSVMGKFVKMDTAVEGADTYLEISFSSSAGTLAAGETANIQSAFNKKDWTNYNQGNDYSYNQAKNVTVYVNGVSTWGTAPGQDKFVSAKIDPATATVDLAKVSDLTINMTLNDATFKGITGLTQGTDYTVNGTAVTISKVYLSTLPVGNTSLTFDFSAGNDPTLTVNVKKSDIVIKDSVIDTINANFDSATPADVVVGVTLNGNNLSAIKNGNAVLVAGKDYTTDGTKIIISKDYLSTLPIGSTSLTFDFSDGADPTLTVNVAAPKGMSVSIGQINAKPGDTVTLPVKLTGELPIGIGSFSYRIKYDPSILEVSGVEAGKAITSPDLNFISSILADKGIVYVQFVDYNVTDADLIKTAGELSNIKFKVKDTAAKGTVAIGFNNTSDAFTDINSNELNVKFTGGSINIQ